VIAHDTVFNREVLGGAGLLFPPEASALASLIDEVETNSDLVAELRARGPERIHKEYTWDKIARQYEQLFLEVAGA
jgi:glycosyltransferase involved in cell wall biosynthesis